MSTTPRGNVTTSTVATARAEATAPPQPLRPRAAPQRRLSAVGAARSRLGQPSVRVSDRIWLIAVCAFAAVLVGSFLTLAISVFVRVPDATSAQVMLTVFTAVLGFLAGLFTPSPIAGKPE